MACARPATELRRRAVTSSLARVASPPAPELPLLFMLVTFEPEPAPSSTKGPTSFRGVSSPSCGIPSAPLPLGRCVRGGEAVNAAAATADVTVVVVAVLDAAKMGRGWTVADAEAEGSEGDEDEAGSELVALGAGVEMELVSAPLVAGVDSRFFRSRDRAARPEVMPELRFIFELRAGTPSTLSEFDCT